jgi:hypothetical protein
MKQVTFFLILLKCFSVLQAQQDTVVQAPDSFLVKKAPVKNDTVLSEKRQVMRDTSLKLLDSLFITDSAVSISSADTLIKVKAGVEPKEIEKKTGEKRDYNGKEILFYYLLFLLILFGLQRQAFQKYFVDLFRVFFKKTLKPRQLREQMLHAQLPSIFMNVFFVLSAGLYINFLLEYIGVSITKNFWLQYGYCAAMLGAIYLVKFFGLKITGWLLNVREVTESYIFIVFIINKMLGISLLPFLFLLAFSTEPLKSISLTISFVLIGLLLVYRIILSYGSVRNEIKLNSFHFILYMLAFEVLPLLLIYKALLIIL